MNISLNKWFRLPQLGRDAFSDLMRAKVKYDTKFGFQFTTETNVTRALSILSSALGEDVRVTKSCFICEAPLEDDSAQDESICAECRERESSYDLYKMKFAKLMETV